MTVANLFGPRPRQPTGHVPPFGIVPFPAASQDALSSAAVLMKNAPLIRI